MTSEIQTESNAQSGKTDKFPEILPILPVVDATLFPGMVLPLIVHGEESQKLVDEAMAKDRLIGIVVSRKKELKISHKPDDIYIAAFSFPSQGTGGAGYIS